MTAPASPADPELEAIVAEIARAPQVHRPSGFWTQLNEINNAMLSDHGLADFKRTIAQNYFNWLVISPRDNQFRSALRDWLCHPTLQPLRTQMRRPDLLRTTDGLERRVGPRQLRVYKLFVGMLWELARRQDWSGMSSRLEEPELGHPIDIRRDGRRISQDLANSIREYCAALSRDRDRPVSQRRVAEIGAGYGRLGYVFLHDPATRYFVFDIPPALYVSQRYLGHLFAGRKVFRFRSFTDFESIREELLAADVAFFTPNQLDLFPPEFFDVFVSISTFPEMRLDQVRHYLRAMSTTTSRYVYLKQWTDWFNPVDKVRYGAETIRLDDDWELVFDRPDAVQTKFFERLWERRRPAGTNGGAASARPMRSR